MKRTIFALLLSLACAATFAQKNWVPFTNSPAQQPIIAVVNSDPVSITFEVDINGMFSENMEEEGEVFQKITLIENQSTGEVGKPALPMLHELIGIPGNKQLSFEVSEVETQKLTGYNIYPFQTPDTDIPGGDKHPFIIHRDFYSKSESFPSASVAVDQPEIWRDVRVSGIHITPFTCNPAKQELTVITHIKVKVTFSGKDTETFVNLSKELTPEFYNLYKQAIVNFEDLGFTQTLRETPGIKYLIITNTEALGAIAPLVDFKNRQGMNVQVRTLENGFNTPQHFKDYISQLYETDGLEYVLMVGDTYPNGGSAGGSNIVPMYFWEPSGEDPSFSDSWYTCLQGDLDHFADLAIGRLVYDNNSLDELELQIQKLMNHYQAPDTTDNWAEYSLLMAHKEEYPLKFTQCCEEIRTYPYSVQAPVFEKAYGGEGASNQQVINFVNMNSCGIFGYRGHGSSTEFWAWGSTGSFSATHVSQLTNLNRLFVLFDCACENMNIATYNGDCLLESFMKHPAGAVAANGAIIPSFTLANHDYAKQMFKAVFNENITSIGYVSNFANITVLNIHGTMGRSNVRTYLWQGDPSLEPWTKQPAVFLVTHDQQIFLGSSEFQVQVNGPNGALENAMVCVSNPEKTLYAVGYTDNSGQATLSFDENVDLPGEASIMVTLHNFLPYQVNIPVLANPAAYVVKDSFQINDTTNGNGLLDYGEQVSLSLGVKNWGLTIAENVVITLSTNDPYITITDNSEYFGNVQPGEVVTMADAFDFEAASSLPDGHVILFEVSATNGSDVWTSKFELSGHAPQLKVLSFTINDASGNNNGLLDQGETAEIVILVGNSGSSTAFDVMGFLTTSDPYISLITTTPQPFWNLEANSSATAGFQVSAATSAPFDYTAYLNFAVSASMGINFQDSIGIYFPDYCQASTSIQKEYISKVVCGTINKTSNWQSGVANYTHITTKLGPGIPKAITVTNGLPAPEDKVVVWVDWNQNKVFGENDETFALTNVGGAGASFTGNITAPLNQPSGNYRMRIRLSFNTNPLPCGNATYGEIEDYGVIVERVTANFSASQTTICNNGQVQFTDLSTGSPTSWLWTFPGGTPSASTKKNQTVTYQNPGMFAVTLQVSNGLTTSILTRPGYISVLTIPTQAGIITGNQNVNAGNTEFYAIEPLPFTTVYDWVLTPESAGVFTREDDTATITWSNSFAGIASLKVCGVNLCGTGGFSPVLLITVLNECPAPACPEVQNITTQAAELSWCASGSENSWNIIYDTTGFVPEVSGILVQGLNQPYCLIENLAQNTNYDFYVQAYCGDGIFSNWSVPGTFTTLDMQNIQLPAGWSGISSYLIPETLNLDSLFQFIMDDLIIVQNETGVYWPGQNINTIGNWDSHTGFSIKVSNAVEFQITGLAENNRTLNLEAGWSLIPVMSKCIINAEALCQNLNMVMIKELAGHRLYWPAMNINNLGNLEPGKAYFILLTEEGDVTFPECFTP